MLHLMPILLWLFAWRARREIFTFAQMPYPAMSNQQIYDSLCAGHRMDKPEHCPYKLFDMMRMMWDGNHADRPSHASIIQLLEGLIADADTDRLLIPGVVQHTPAFSAADEDGYAMPMGTTGAGTQVANEDNGYAMPTVAPSPAQCNPYTEPSDGCAMVQTKNQEASGDEAYAAVPGQASGDDAYAVPGQAIHHVPTMQPVSTSQRGLPSPAYVACASCLSRLVL